MATITNTEIVDDAIVRATGYYRGYQDLGGSSGQDYEDVHHENAYNQYIHGGKLPTFEPIATGHPAVGGNHILDVFPDEITVDIVRQLDIKTALRFRQANRRIYHLISNQVEFRMVIQHAHACLMAALRNGTARSLTFAHIYRALLLQRCESCDKLACFLYLPTATKACEECIGTHSDFDTVPLSSFSHPDGSQLDGDSLMILRKSLPVAEIATSDLFGKNADWETIEAVNLQKLLSLVKAGLRYDTGSKARTLYRKLRYKTSVPLPTLDPETGTAYRHLACNGCLLEHWGSIGVFLNPNCFIKCAANYTKEQFVEHFESCRGAQHIWALTKGGAVRDIGLEYEIHGGQDIRNRLNFEAILPDFPDDEEDVREG